ncbi:MAG: hypothetical protein IJY28_01635 [Clostridia bacterium]|nr:hypothetical protein [Clostridia bacterium]
MKKMMQWMKQHKVCTIIVGVLLFGLLLNGVLMWCFRDRVVYFDVADYLDRQTGTSKAASGMCGEYQQDPLSVVDGFTRRQGLNADGELKTPENTQNLIVQGGGVILVVRPVGLRQNLVILDEHRERYTEMPFWKTHTNNWLGVSVERYTKTTVVIEEVVYQSEYTHYRAGQSVIVREGYGIVDGRFPLSSAEYGGKPYASTLCWTPMENGETYIVYGNVWDYVTASGKKYEPATKDMVIAQADGVYCLSDLEKLAGWHINDRLLEAGNDFLHNKYPQLKKYESK